MVFLAVMVMVALAMAAVTMRSSRRATRVGIGAVTAAVVAVIVAEVTGNFLILYLGTLAALFGVFVLLARFAGAVRHWNE